MENKVNVLFWLRNQNSKKGLLPVYYYLTVNGKKSTGISTGIKCLREEFDSETQLLTNRPTDNEFLKTIINKANKKKLWFETLDQIVTLEEFLKFGEESKTKPIPTLKALIKEYYEYEIQRGKMSESTMKTYKLRFNNVLQYLTHSNTETLSIESVNKVWAWKMLSWITSNEGRKTNKEGANSNSYASRHVLLLNKAINYSKSVGYVAYNKLDGFDYVVTPKKEMVYLNMKERDLLHSHRFASECLQQVADIYTLMCHTGLDAIDVAVFEVKINLHKDHNGHYIISGKRVKNGYHYIVPVSEVSFHILQKYLGKNLAECQHLPVLCNQSFNRYLKEIALILGINKRLTTKVSRRTFATLMINDLQITKDAVSKMLGHCSVKTLEANYADVHEYRIINEVASKMKIQVG